MQSLQEDLTYNPDGSPRYAWKGRPILSVTEILKLAGMIDDRWFTEWASNKGTAIHSACAQMDLETLDWKNLDPQIIGYVLAYQKFQDETGFVSGLIEKSMYNSVYDFAGTPDRIGILNDSTTIVDFKSGIPLPWHGLQTAAYDRLYDGNRTFKRMGLYLREDGTYRMHFHNDRNDWPTFLAAMSVAKWKLIYGGKPT